MIHDLGTRRPEAARGRHEPPLLALDSDFGGLNADVLDLVERRYAERGLNLSREPTGQRREEDDIVCFAREGQGIVGTLTVRLDGPGGLHADALFRATLDAWRADGVRLCEFGALAVDPQAHDPRQVLAQVFHLGYLHAHRRAGCERLVIEVNPRHAPFYRRCLGLEPMSGARFNARVQAPAVLMSIDFATVREQIALWGGRPDCVAMARSFYPLAWDAATEASKLAELA